MANKLPVLVCQIVPPHGRLSDIRAASDKIYIITSVRHKNYSITILIACCKWFPACVLILSYYLSLFYSYVVHSYTHTTIILSITIFHTHFEFVPIPVSYQKILFVIGYSKLDLFRIVSNTLFDFFPVSCLSCRICDRNTEEKCQILYTIDYKIHTLWWL